MTLPLKRGIVMEKGIVMISEESQRILKLLARSRNVLISGPPATGKSKILSEVAHAFENGYGLATLSDIPQSNSTPLFNPDSAIPIPARRQQSESSINALTQSTTRVVPASKQRNRKVFRTVFHQNSTYRDFVTGITPSIADANEGLSFTVVEGTLYRASQHVLDDEADSAALLIIDEINRGPAVQIFGGSIVAIEPDKRKPANSFQSSHETQYFEILDPSTGKLVEYALPENLYILAAMNQADASVEPLDVAFLRRWEPISLTPNIKVLKEFYELDSYVNSTLPESLDMQDDIIKKGFLLEASMRAWVAVNEKISIGRGSEYQIGHGFLMTTTQPRSLSLDEVYETLCVGWAKIRAHIEEVFFGDVQGIAAMLNAGSQGSIFKLKEVEFANIMITRIQGPESFTADNIYSVLKSILKD